MSEKKYYVVGASFSSTKDVSDKFLKKSIWYDGYADTGDEQNRSILEKINIGDVLLMKSSSTKGTGHSITFTKLKGIGIVLEKKDYYYFKMRWLDFPEASKDFDGISYRKTIEPARNDDMLIYVRNIVELEDIEEYINLLKYKHQIILQGPPGTGKTRLAKLMAKKMTEPKNLGSPQEKVDSFFKNFDASDPRVLEERQRLNNLLQEFQNKFPKEKLKNLTLENYTLGTGSNESFCWWIERGLKPLGYYFPGTARSYLIYWSKKDEDYSIHGRLLHDINDPEIAMKKLAGAIDDLITKKNFKTITNFFGDSLLLKLLHSYYPNEYFPINSVLCLNNALKLLEIDYSDLNPLEKNLKLQELFNQKKKKFKTDVTSLEFMKFLFDHFDLKGDISVESSKVVAKGEYKVIQFHPAYTYEDFVRGISIKINEEGPSEYKVENRILTEFAEKALKNPSANFVLIIDEINRANLPSVFGELIYALEYRFDEKNSAETSVESMYALKTEGEDSEGSKELKLPSNLYFIGTMNSADRSVGHIDYAIRRRFAFVNVLPKIIPELTEKGKLLFEAVAKLFCEEFIKGVNNLKNSQYLAVDFNPTNVILGHSYFLIQEEEKENLKISEDEILRIKLNYEIKPILREYLKDGILLEGAAQEIEELDKWIN